MTNGPDDHASGPLYQARRRAGQAAEWRVEVAREVWLSETLCADDTGAYFLSREDLAKDTPLLFQLLED